MNTTSLRLPVSSPILIVAALCWFATPAHAGDEYYLHPPGCLWSSLVMTNVSDIDLAGSADAVVVSGNYLVPDGLPLDMWGQLIKLNAASGATLLSRDYFDDGTNCWINTLIPVASGSSVVGFAFAGMKHHEASVYPWSGPWTWAVRLDLNLATLFEAHVGRDQWGTWADAIAQTPSGFAAGGMDVYLAGGSYPALFSRFDSSLNLTATNSIGSAGSTIHSIAPGIGGGYVLCLGSPDWCVRKYNSSMTLEWQAVDDTPTNCTPPRYTRIAPVADGYVALGSNTCSSAATLVLTKFATDGTVLWSRANANGYGADLVPAADGGWLVIGTSRTRRLDNAHCVWLLKTDASGVAQWEMCLGGDEGSRGLAGALASDGDYLAAGEAMFEDGTNRLWVVRIDSSQQAPVPSFTYTPASPVFRDQQISFDASASTAPGGAIAAYEWDFGDGTTGTGVIVAHTYHQPGTNTVTLTIVNTNGVLASTNREIEIVGLALQWERFYGNADEDIGYSLVEARDGGFVVAGGTSGNYASDYDFWVFKTDSRGRLLWTTNINNSIPSSSGAARCVIQAHDTGYVVAGHQYIFTNSNWRYDPWLVKLDEDGALAWPIRVPGELGYHELALAVTATSDGGYMVTGARALSADFREPWLLKTDGDGNTLWATNITRSSRAAGRFVTPTADGGYLVTCGSGWEGEAPPIVTYKTDATGFPLWTNTFTSSGSYEGGGRWIAETSDGGAVVVGGSARNIQMVFLNPDGTVRTSKNWSCPIANDKFDNGRSAAITPDGGYIIGGYFTYFNSTYSQQTEVALIRTDSNGDTNWIETLPGTTNFNESAHGVVALSDNTFVVLAYREVKSTAANPHTVWLFKLAPNHPPVPQMTFSPNPAAPGQILTFDASASYDTDGTVAAWEWDFGDGTTTNGVIVQHTYTNAGSFPVRLTVVDDDGAERSITNWPCSHGIAALSAGVTLTFSEITNAPDLDPANYPPAGAPDDLDWASAYGFRLTATGGNGSKTFRIAFCDTVNPNFLLYRLPAWANVTYANINFAALDVPLTIASGSVNATLILAKAIPSTVIVDHEFSGADRLALTFETQPGYNYRVMRSQILSPADWQSVNHALTAGGALSLETFPGTGANATVYLGRPSTSTAFYRIRVESP